MIEVNDEEARVGYQLLSRRSRWPDFLDGLLARFEVRTSGPSAAYSRPPVEPEEEDRGAGRRGADLQPLLPTS